MTSDVKKCPSCGETKPLSDFGGPKATRLRVYCSKCNSARAKAWIDANPEKAKATRQAYIASGKYRQTDAYKHQMERARVPPELKFKRRHDDALARIEDELANGKICTICDQRKPLSEFANCGKPRYPEYPDLHAKRPECKQCWSRLVWLKQIEKRGEKSTPKT